MTGLPPCRVALKQWEHVGFMNVEEGTVGADPSLF